MIAGMKMVVQVKIYQVKIYRQSNMNQEILTRNAEFLHSSCGYSLFSGLAHVPHDIPVPLRNNSVTGARKISIIQRSPILVLFSFLHYGSHSCVTN